MTMDKFTRASDVPVGTLTPEQRVRRMARQLERESDRKRKSLEERIAEIGRVKPRGGDAA
jgi:hypothetical protein